MQHKKFVLFWIGLWLVILTGCWNKGIDESDLVSFEYKYSFEDWTVIEEWSKELTIWDTWNFTRIEPIILWSKQDDELKWTINGKEIYKSEYNPNKVLAYPNIILTEVMWISNPKIWTEIEVDNIWNLIITNIEKDSDWYDSFVVDFNDPKTYSELSYYIKITNITKL